MPEIKGIEYLREKLYGRLNRVQLRYDYYDAVANERPTGVVIPENLRRMYRSTLGWCAKAVNSIADRLVFREFANDDFRMNDIFKLNNPDTFFDSAMLGALISSCTFVYISPGEDGFPRLQVIDGANATGVIDSITGLLYEGYAILERDDRGSPSVEAHFLPYATDFYYKNKPKNEQVVRVAHKVGYPLLVPVIHRPDAVRPFGRSRISRPCMYTQAYAKRTLERSDITAEFYSFPQKYILGLSQDADPLDRWKATISSMLTFTKDDQGEHPTVGQFSQPSQSPFTEQLRTAASLFAGETGLTLDDLGFVTDNPPSNEAIKASHETLRIAAGKAQRNFGSGFLNVGYLAVCLRDDFTYQRSQLYRAIPKWEPLFEPDASTLSLIGDGAIKINKALPGYLTPDALRDLTGIANAADSEDAIDRLTPFTGIESEE